MPDRQKIGRSVGDGPLRTFFVTFTDDGPDRREAIEFFSKLTQPLFSGGRPKALFPASPTFPDNIDRLSDEDAQAYFDANPVERQWASLTLLQQDGVADHELYRLKFIPELKRLHFSGVGDEALSHVVYLQSLTCLVVYSPHITDACLQYVKRLTSLKALDFKASPQITQKAFAETFSSLPNIVDAYPPHRNGDQ
ncbi:MAG: hypothetical protein U0903_06245 [Planctomycetales bacterium]